MKTHELKIWPEYYKAVHAGHKTYEIRDNDREFAFGDQVILREWDPTRDFVDSSCTQLKEPRGYTKSRPLMFWVGYIYRLPNHPKDVPQVVFSLLREDPFGR